MEQEGDFQAETGQIGPNGEKRPGAAVETAGEKARAMGEAVVSYVEQHPFAALGMAAAAGFIFSSIVRR